METVRTFREGDEAAILALLSESTGVECTLDEWAWLFPPEEGGRAIVVGESGGQVTAVCAGRPVRVAAAGREWPAVALAKIVSRDRNNGGEVVEYFAEAIAEAGRFAAAIASFESQREVPAGFESASRPRPAVLLREKPVSAPVGRLFYRAEPARHWEPRLDELWRRARKSYLLAMVRDADRASRLYAAHPEIRHHRFLVCPRFSGSAVAFAVFAIKGERCRWVDLVWDHDHPGALELVASISSRLVGQLGGAVEELWLAGDDDAHTLLTKRGFRPDDASTAPVLAARALVPEFPVSAFVEGAYLTLSDAEGHCS